MFQRFFTVHSSISATAFHKMWSWFGRGLLGSDLAELRILKSEKKASLPFLAHFPDADRAGSPYSPIIAAKPEIWRGFLVQAILDKIAKKNKNFTQEIATLRQRFRNSPEENSSYVERSGWNHFGAFAISRPGSLQPVSSFQDCFCPMLKYSRDYILPCNSWRILKSATESSSIIAVSLMRDYFWWLKEIELWLMLMSEVKKFKSGWVCPDFSRLLMISWFHRCRFNVWGLQEFGRDSQACILTILEQKLNSVFSLPLGKKPEPEVQARRLNHAKCFEHCKTAEAKKVCMYMFLRFGCYEEP